MIDFTLLIYKRLLNSLLEKNYNFLTVEEYFTGSKASSPGRLFAPSQDRPLAVAPSPSHPASPPRPAASSQTRPVAPSPRRQIIIMRHDVDRKPQNALRMAKLEHELEVKATYYFRTIPQTLKPEIIKQIAELGHEIGYHYENLATANSRMKNVKCKMKNEEAFKEKLFELAIKDFENNLARLRDIVPIKNICMHGSPLSKWDSRDLWKKYNYKDYGIISEPYFDLDFQQVQYITDAGRSWDNAAINLRDKVESPFSNNFKHTKDIIKAVQDNKLSDQIMFNIHPEHWAFSKAEWWKIWAVRKAKNGIKRVILKRRRRGADER